MKKKVYDFSSPAHQGRALKQESMLLSPEGEGWVRRNRLILFHIILFLYTEIR